MEVSGLLFRLILIFIPGLIYLFITRNFTRAKAFNAFEVFIFSIIFGLFSYFILSFLYKVNSELTVWKIFKFSNDTQLYIDRYEILFASLISLVLSIIYIFIHTNNLIYKALHFLKLTNKFGEDSCLYNFFNYSNKNIVTIFHFDNNLTYHGFLFSFSEEGEFIELHLVDADVYLSHNNQKQLNNKEMYLRLHKSANFFITIKE